MKSVFALLALWCLCLIPRSGIAEWSLPLHGFVEYDIGSRIVPNEQYADETILHEAVFRVEIAKDSDIAAFHITTDARWDEFLHDTNLDIREAHITLFPADWWEIKIGRQILNWGTGERIFVNDLFPKDWRSFLIGREDEYLHAPVTGVKLDLLTDIADTTAVVVPRFTPDTSIDGERLSYWDRHAMTSDGVLVEKPEQTLANVEYHVRLTKNLIHKVVEVALYGYKGFFKRPQPTGDLQNLKHFPELAVYGFSIRVPSPVAVFNIESSYYDSLDDRKGTDPLIPNSMVKSLVGCKVTLIKNSTTTVQYSFEWMQTYDEYLQSIASAEQSTLKKEYRDWITVDVTHLRHQERLRLSLFGSYSPVEHDWFLRPQITYWVSEPVQVTAGANLFFGEHEYTSFGQYQDNSHVFVRIRYTY